MLHKKSSCDLGTRIIKIKGTPSPFRGDLNPLDDVKNGGYTIEFDTNNVGGDNLGFRLELSS